MRALLAFVAGVQLVAAASSVTGCANWVNQGPFVSRDADSCDTLTNAYWPNNAYAGAAERVVTAGNVAYVGTVNGGVWKTNDFSMAATTTDIGLPHWFPSTEQSGATCSSIAALAIDPADATKLAAGCGYPSNYKNIGSQVGGVMITANAGDTWSMTQFGVVSAMTGATPDCSGTGNNGVLQLGISDIVLSSSAIMVSVSSSRCGQGILVSSSDKLGIWRSVDAGASWTKVYTPAISNKAVFSMRADPVDATFISAVSAEGVAVSLDGGASFTLSAGSANLASNNVVVSDADNAVVSSATVGGTRRIYAGFFRETGKRYGIFWSDALASSTSPGAVWTAMAEPGTTEGSTFKGLGSQGSSNFCILADPTDLDFVYVGGTGNPGSSSIGNVFLTGRLFRGRKSLNSWTSLVGSSTYTAQRSGASASGPHTDTRYFWWHQGSLLNTNDGGVYMRTSPQTSAGSWFSLNGDMATQELISADLDPINGVVIGGAQDNACFMTNYNGGVAAFKSGQGLDSKGLPGGDGGYVNVDMSRAGAPLYQTTSQELGAHVSLKSNFDKPSPIGTTDAYLGTGSGNQWNSLYGDHMGLPGSGKVAPFHPFLALNAIDSTMTAVCVTQPNTGCYKVASSGSPTGNGAGSLAFATTSLGSTYMQAYAYGGTSASGVANKDVFLGVSGSDGVYTRTSATGAGTLTATSGAWGTSWNGRICHHLSLNPKDYTEALTTCGDSQGPSSKAWLSSNFGLNWVDISGSGANGLTAVSGALYDIYSWSTLIMNMNDGARAYLIGAYNGVYVTYSTYAPSSWYWRRVGAAGEFPNVFATQMRWYPSNAGQFGIDVLLVSTLGRSVWSIINATAVIDSYRSNACPAAKTLASPATASRASPVVDAPILPGPSGGAAPFVPPPMPVPPAPSPSPAPSPGGQTSDALVRSTAAGALVAALAAVAAAALAA